MYFPISVNLPAFLDGTRFFNILSYFIILQPVQLMQRNNPQEIFAIFIEYLHIVFLFIFYFIYSEYAVVSKGQYMINSVLEL